jgi:hypothetical protein
MRLGQLSRKIKVKPQEIVAFVSENFQEELSIHPNTKIKEEHLVRIEAHFVTAESPESTPEELIQPEEPFEVEYSVPKKEEIEFTVELESTQSDEEKNVPASIQNTDLAEPSEDDLNIVDGVIKAPKVAVEGIKVVGKIDLPEPKKEEEEGDVNNEEDEQIDATAARKKTSQQQSRKKSQRKSKRNKEGKREISYEEQKKMDLAAYEARKKAQKEAEKKKKQRHYEKQLKNKQAVEKSKKSKKKKEAANAAKAIEKQPKTAWGKFIKWLNT